MSDTEAFHAVVSGRVQGVCFRACTQDQARALGLDGWVRNLPDGRVEVKAWGRAGALARLRDWLRQGPETARVDDLQLGPAEPEGGAGFDIRY